MLDKDQLAALRKLRLWHFRQMKQAQDTRDKRRADGEKKAAKYWDRQVEFHSEAVEAINPMFDIGDAASSDDVAQEVQPC